MAIFGILGIYIPENLFHVTDKNPDFEVRFQWSSINEQSHWIAMLAFIWSKEDQKCQTLKCYIYGDIQRRP